MTAADHERPDWVPVAKPRLHHYQTEEAGTAWLTLAPTDPPTNRVTTAWLTSDTWVSLEGQR
jgi:hypothetical protein